MSKVIIGNGGFTLDILIEAQGISAQHKHVYSCLLYLRFRATLKFRKFKVVVNRM